MSGPTAQLVTSSLAGGAHTLSAIYGGDTRNNPGTSSPLVISVADPLTPPTASASMVALKEFG